MIKWIDWGSKNQFLTIGISVMYFLCVVLPHEIIGVQIAALFQKHGRPFYDKVLLIIFVVLFLTTVIFLYRKIKNHPRKGRILFFGLANTFFAILCYTIIFVVNVEAIHFLQYAIFALIVFPLTRNYTYTHIWATLAGTCDELYQYLVLSPQRTDYFDFNDVVINMVGAAFGLIMIFIYNPISNPFSWSAFRSSKLCWFLIALILGVTALFVSGLASYHPTESSWFILQKEVIPWFWYELPPAVVFHVMTPLEGVIIVLFLLLFFSKLDKGSKNKIK